jgi:hypothetical protein
VAVVVFGVVIWLGLKGWLANLPDFVSWAIGLALLIGSLQAGRLLGRVIAGRLAPSN